MKPHNIVIGQEVKAELVERARQFRREPTPDEKILWQQLRHNRLGGFHFRRQQIIHGFVVDFYCHAVGLIVEVDGPIHEQQIDRDAARDEKLKSLGFKIVRFKNEEITKQLENVLAQILESCRERT